MMQEVASPAKSKVAEVVASGRSRMPLGIALSQHYTSPILPHAVVT
jgi:hypothetical protein